MGLHRPLSAVAMSALVAVSAIAPAAATSPGQNGLIAYELRLEGRVAIWSADATGGAQRSVIDLVDRDAVDPAWSRDGRHLAYAAELAPGGPFAIFTSDADGSNRQQVTTPVASDIEPTWSPHGDEIAFTRTYTDGTSHIEVVNLDELSVRELVGWPDHVGEPSWSPGGNQIAFTVFEVPDGWPCDGWSACVHLGIVRPSDGRIYPLVFADELTPTYRDADWLPSSDLLAVTYQFGPLPTWAAVLVVDPQAGVVVDQYGGNGAVSEPAPSPDGTLVALRAVETDDAGVPIAEEISITDPTSGVVASIIGPVGDPAWAVAPGTEAPIVPDGDFTGPTLTFDTDPQPVVGDWYAHRVTMTVTAEDGASVPFIECTIDGDPADGVPISHPGGMMYQFKVPDYFHQASGMFVVACTAEDGLGNQSAATTHVGIDRIPPRITEVTATPDTVPVGTTFEIFACAADDEVGLEQVVATTDWGPWVELTPLGGCGYGGELAAGSVTGWPQSFFVRADDILGNTRTEQGQVMVFDPAASVSGKGGLTPNGPTSLPGDRWTVPLDGKRRASFSIDARYRKDAVAPSGSLVLGFGTTQFKSTDLRWLVRGALQGTGVFKGSATPYPFRLELTDGGPSNADYLVLRIFDPSMDPFDLRGLAPLFQVSGETTGQVVVG